MTQGAIWVIALIWCMLADREIFIYTYVDTVSGGRMTYVCKECVKNLFVDWLAVNKTGKKKNWCSRCVFHHNMIKSAVGG